MAACSTETCLLPPNATLELKSTRGTRCPVVYEARLRNQLNLTTYRYMYSGNFSNISPLPCPKLEARRSTEHAPHSEVEHTITMLEQKPASASLSSFGTHTQADAHPFSTPHTILISILRPATDSSTGYSPLNICTSELQFQRKETFVRISIT